MIRPEINQAENTGFAKIKVTEVTMSRVSINKIIWHAEIIMACKKGYDR